MRDAFVIRLSPETDPDERHFVGWVEEIDTARELRFRSTAELLGFLGRCVEDGRRRAIDGGHGTTDRESETDEA